MLTGKSLIAGNWQSGAEVFLSDPAYGNAHRFFKGTVDQVNAACAAAEKAFWSFGYVPREMRATFLDRIAEEIDLLGDEITQIGSQETGLPEARLVGERGRTTGQLRLFAAHIREGAHLDLRHDAALPDRAPIPRPELHMVQRPIGPVAVFGASNFPLAFSTAGGDTAAALAAGCPVVVKGHPAHPGTGELVAQAIHTARAALDLDPGVFSFVQDGGIEVGSALVRHPLIKAVGFTGSLRGGRALFDMCAARPEPIPFFGELGSINPMFILPQAGARRAAEIAVGWAGSLTMGAGQFCTNPGVAVVPKSVSDEFTSAAKDALNEGVAQTMLTDGIASAFAEGKDRIEVSEGVEKVLVQDSTGRDVHSQLYRTTAAHWLSDESLGHEVFGPLAIVVTADSDEQMLDIANALNGQLTCTLHLDPADHPLAQRFVPILERKAGRILANGFPTGVEVSDTMVHGGPYPASTNFGATSVGTLSIRRFLRPVCYQGLPDELLPGDLPAAK